MKLLQLALAFLTFSSTLTWIEGRYSVDAPSDRPAATGLPRYKEPLAEEDRQRDATNCGSLLTQEQKDEIAGYQNDANIIIDAIMNGKWKGETYKELSVLAHNHPVRLSGMQNLEDSIDYMMDKMNQLGLENVRGEQVLVPHWVRGEETATMRLPWEGKNIQIMGLGTTVGTPEEGITADVIVVRSFDELDSRAAEVDGKIVVYNQGWVTYGHGYQYRNEGASRAANYGAVGVLLRSVCPFSLNTVHVGGQNYWDNVTQIPIGAITVEDADTMLQLQTNGERIQVTMKLLDYNLPMTTSRNVIGEIGGTGVGAIPEQYVGVSGHIDSWDLGQGVMDDAGGVMISVMAVAILKDLGFIPKRRLQAILWTSEEPGLWGVDHFVQQHDNILANYSAIFESDGGTFDPEGLDFGGDETAGCVINEILKLTEATINTTFYQRHCMVSSDITKLQEKGVPGVSNKNKNDMYFWYHHTEADTMTMMDTTELDRSTAMWAVASYVVADLDAQLTRETNDKCAPPTP